MDLTNLKTSNISLNDNNFDWFLEASFENIFPIYLGDQYFEKLVVLRKNNANIKTVQNFKFIDVQINSFPKNPNARVN